MSSDQPGRWLSSESEFPPRVSSQPGEDREGVIILNLMDSLINLREKLTAGKRLKRSSCANLDDLFCNINELIQLVK